MTGGHSFISATKYQRPNHSHRNAGRLHWGKAESIELCDFRVGQATTCAEAQFWLRQPLRNPPPPPSSFPILQSASEMTYIVSGWALYSIHSLTPHHPTSAPPHF